MARVHFWSFIVNETGVPIEGADISVYLAGTTTDATLYLDEFSSSSVSTAPQVTSNTNGYFEFWLPDISSSGGYSATQKFKLAWEKTGVASGFVDYVDFYPTTLAVDESDTNTTKDKSVSNYLANLWEAHRLDDSYTVHGLAEVDETDVTTLKNKLVSNNLAKTWTDHESLTFATSGTSGSTYVMGTSADEYPHGIQPMNLSDTPLPTEEAYWKRNKLVSYHYVKKWDDHLDIDYSDEPHGMEPVDILDTNTEINKLVSNNIIKVLYDNLTESFSQLRAPDGSPDPAMWIDNDGNATFTANVSAATYTGDGSGLTNVTSVAAAHATSHTDGTDDIQDADTSQKGLLTASDWNLFNSMVTSGALSGVNSDITSLTGLDDDGIPLAKVANAASDGVNNDITSMTGLTSFYAPIKTIKQPDTDTLTATECSGTIITNYGQSAENTQTLPTGAEGLNGMFTIGTSGMGDFHVKAGPTNRIYLDGVPLDYGDKVTLTSPALGNFFTYFSFQVGASQFDWIFQTGQGTLTDGGA